MGGSGAGHPLQPYHRPGYRRISATTVRVNTTTYTTTYVAGNLLRSLKQLITGCGLDPHRLVGADYTTLELGIKTWLDSRHLEAVTLEVFKPGTGALVGRFDFGIDYGYGAADDGGFWLDSDSVAFAIRKSGVSAADCDYRILADNKPGRPDVAGWSTTSYRFTDGFTCHAVGTAIGAGSVGVGITYYARNS